MKSAYNAQNVSLKIVMVAHEGPRGGTGITTFNTAKDLAELGHEVVLVLPGPEQVTHSMPDNLSVITIPNDAVNWFETSAIMNEQMDTMFGELLEIVKPDIVHLRHFLYQSANYLSVTHSRDIPTVVSLHDGAWLCPQWGFLLPNGNLCSGPETAEKCTWCMGSHSGLKDFNLEQMREISGKLCARRMWLKGLLLLPDRVISISKFIRKMFHKYGPRKDSVLIPTGIQYFKAKKKTVSDVIRFGFFGHLIAHKGLGTLLKAWEEIYKAYGDKATLTLFGKQFQPIHPSLMEGVKKHGPYNFEDLPNLYKNIDVAIVPSLTECRCRTIREAFIAKTPVLCSDIPPNIELVEDGKDSMVFDVRRPSDLRNAMSQLIARPEKIEKLTSGIKKQRTVREETKDLIILYEEIINDTKRQEKSVAKINEWKASVPSM